jgi:hypothetical protein
VGYGEARQRTDLSLRAARRSWPSPEPAP